MMALWIDRAMVFVFLCCVIVMTISVAVNIENRKTYCSMAVVQKHHDDGTITHEPLMECNSERVKEFLAERDYVL